MHLIVHLPLITLLSRHAQTLSSRSSHSSLPAGDEVAMSLIPELELMVSILQGLCLLSRKAKKATGQSWIMEVSPCEEQSPVTKLTCDRTPDIYRLDTSP